MSPSDLRQLVTELEHIVEKRDATDSTRAWKFRQLLNKVYAAGFEDGHYAGGDDEHRANRVAEKLAKAAAEEQR